MQYPRVVNAAGTRGRLAVVVPGRRFGPYAPLLMFAGRAACDRGAQLRPLTWDEDDLREAEQSNADPADWVGAHVREKLPSPQTGDSSLLIGKSMGSYAAAFAAERRLPAIRLTPLLRDPAVVDALRIATAPFLLIGGTADLDAWLPQMATGLTPHVLQVPDADHGMYVPGPLAQSTAVLGEVVTAIETFLDDTVWPDPTS